MSATTNVNFRTVVHQKSNGLATFFPDVCKTPAPPAPPIPIPYPNIAQSSQMAQGSTQVKIDGSPVMLQNSNFSTSSGDEAGSAGGGVMSNTIKGKAEFLNYSFDVKIEGKNVPRLGDMMLGNKQSSPNTPPMPEVQAPLVIVSVPETEVTEDLDLEKLEEVESDSQPDEEAGGDDSRSLDSGGKPGKKAPKSGPAEEEKKEPVPTLKVKWSKKEVTPDHNKNFPPASAPTDDIPDEAKVTLEAETTDVPDGTAAVIEIRHAKSGSLVKNGSLPGLQVKGDKVVVAATGKPPEWTFQAEHTLWDPWDAPFYYFKARVEHKSLEAETPRDFAAMEGEPLRLNYWHACLADGHADAAPRPLDTIGDVKVIKQIILGLPHHLAYPEIINQEKVPVELWGSVFRNCYSYYHSSHGLDDVIYIGKTEIDRGDASETAKVPSVPKYFIYFDACLTGVDGRFAGAFIKRGTRNVMAFRKSIRVDEARQTAKEFYTSWCQVHKCDPAKIPAVFSQISPPHYATMSPVLYGQGGEAPKEGLAPGAQAAIVIAVIAGGAAIGLAAYHLLK